MAAKMPGMLTRMGILAAAFGLLTVCGRASAHHSYSMFDAAKQRTVSGTVAKLEWMNPHAFVWLYVRQPNAPGKYDLYAFENGSVNALTRLGWSATSLKAGDRITVEYWPVKDGRMGGHLNTATLPDGRVLRGAGGPEVRDGRAPAPAFELPKLQQSQH
ncbi:MAG TPA: DUF6152 family protein [Steroidobacteraceae bacterium]|nr:DUF6152 family protein [Steroidobacteraceae bacterium]